MKINALKFVRVTYRMLILLNFHPMDFGLHLLAWRDLY